MSSSGIHQNTWLLRSIDLYAFVFTSLARYGTLLKPVCTLSGKCVLSREYGPHLRALHAFTEADTFRKNI